MFFQESLAQAERLNAFRKGVIMEFFDFSFFKNTNFDINILQLQVISTKGKRSVSQVASAETGSLVTMVGIINATGSSLPPFYIFPRVRFNAHFINDGPTGYLGISDKCGWMTSKGFFDVLYHIKVNTKKKTQYIPL